MKIIQHVINYAKHAKLSAISLRPNNLCGNWKCPCLIKLHNCAKCLCTIISDSLSTDLDTNVNLQIVQTFWTQWTMTRRRGHELFVKTRNEKIHRVLATLVDYFWAINQQSSISYRSVKFAITYATNHADIKIFDWSDRSDRSAGFTLLRDLKDLKMMQTNFKVYFPQNTSHNFWNNPPKNNNVK